MSFAHIYYLIHLFFFSNAFWSTVRLHLFFASLLEALAKKSSFYSVCISFFFSRPFFPLSFFLLSSGAFLALFCSPFFFFLVFDLSLFFFSSLNRSSDPFSAASCFFFCVCVFFSSFFPFLNFHLLLYFYFSSCFLIVSFFFFSCFTPLFSSSDRDRDWKTSKNKKENTVITKEAKIRKEKKKRA